MQVLDPNPNPNPNPNRNPNPNCVQVLDPRLCGLVACSRAAYTTLGPHEGLQILGYGINSPALTRIACDLLCLASTDELECFIPSLVVIWRGMQA